MKDLSLEALISEYVIEELLSHTVLLVDDEPGSLQELHAFLPSRWKVHFAQSGTEALQYIESKPIDVVIVDQNIPGLTGVEFLERLRYVRPDIAGIVLASCVDMPEMVSAANRARAFRYLRKPWLARDVVEAVDDAMEYVFHSRAIRRLIEMLARKSEQLSTALERLEIAHGQMLHMDRLSTVGRLSAGIAHDLRGAMTGLLYIETEGPKRGMPQELYRLLTSGLSRVSQLLSQFESIRDYSQAGNLNMVMESVEARSIVEDAVALLQMDPEVRVRQIEIQVDAGIPALSGDRQKLIQVIVNLIRNAAQATVRGQHIWIKAALDPRAYEVIFSVDDEGPGVIADDQERIFEPFVSSKGQNGSGLGLYLARLVVESHRGQIRCIPRKEGKGASFEFRLRIGPKIKSALSNMWDTEGTGFDTAVAGDIEVLRDEYLGMGRLRERGRA